MTKRIQKTKVIINGLDVGSHVMAVNLPRFPEAAEQVQLTLAVDRLEVDDDGTLVVHVETRQTF